MDVLVIGGGASGMMAAITAAKSHHVTLLERQSRVGRKLLATGNGRCNLSNADLSPAHFHGEAPSFALPALRAFGGEDTLRFFRENGLLTVTEPGGRIYPYSDQANSVLDVLRFALDAAGVALHTGCEVRSAAKRGDRFTVRTAEETFSADRLIIAAGGLAGSKLGGSLSGYQLLMKFRHTRTALLPSLVQLRTDDTFVRSLKGVRAECRATLRAEGALRAEDCGEVQFTEYGVSGPVIFNLSRAASAAGADAEVVLDLLPQLTADEVCEMLAQRCRIFPTLTADDLFTGMLHNRLGRTLLRCAGLGGALPLSALSDDDLRAAAAAAKAFTLPLRGTMDMDHAQVTAGGIRTAEFDPDTMESRLCPGLYACGEVLDIDGDCGGYNLQWAWSSGHAAGLLREKERSHD